MQEVVGSSPTSSIDNCLQNDPPFEKHSDGRDLLMRRHATPRTIQPGLLLPHHREPTPI